jgi:TRAP-type transport system small permease protein
LLERIGSKIDKGVEVFIAILFILMVIVGGLQVFNRFILNHSLSWSEEYQKFSHIWLIFLTIPVAYNRGSHIGMQVLFNKFASPVQKIFNVIFDLLWLCLSLAIVYYSFVIMGVAKTQTSAGLGLRMDKVYFGLVIGGIYLLFISIRKLVEHFSTRDERVEGPA